MVGIVCTTCRCTGLVHHAVVERRGGKPTRAWLNVVACICRFATTPQPDHPDAVRARKLAQARVDAANAEATRC